LAVLDPDNQEVKTLSEKIYSELNALGIDVLMDDRNERPGVKFKDADLLGMPLRVNIGARGLAAGELELIERKSKAIHKVAPEGVIGKIQGWLKENAT
jgi:prolyl-tRNA synthetase